MPNFMDVEDVVPTTNGLFQFRHSPRTGEGMFVVGMLAGGGEIVVDAGAAEREREFGVVTIRKNRMIESRRKNGAFG